MDHALDMVGLPIVGGLSLIMVAIVWYRLGGNAGKLAIGIALLLAARKHIRDQTKAEIEAKQNEAKLDAIHRADQVRQRTRRDNAGDGLRGNDGYRRD